MADVLHDATVIGTSQGGRFLPIELAKAGQKVALMFPRGRARRLAPHHYPHAGPGVVNLT